MNKKFYAVKIGNKPGIYTSWEECKEQISHFKGARYKSFESEEEAKKYMNQEAVVHTKENPIDLSKLDIYAFTDGSYDKATRVCGWGSYIIQKFPDGAQLDTQITGWCEMKEDDNTRNITGELRAVMDTLNYCHEHKIQEITIIYDYQGVECWANNEWKTNKPITTTYKKYIDDARDKWGMTINFIKVKGHSNVEGNEIADALAKESVYLGIETITNALFGPSKNDDKLDKESDFNGFITITNTLFGPSNNTNWIIKNTNDKK